jgi:hypothetical protein
MAEADEMVHRRRRRGAVVDVDAGDRAAVERALQHYRYRRLLAQSVVIVSRPAHDDAVDSPRLHQIQV